MKDLHIQDNNIMSINRFATIASGILIFTMGKFQFADLIGIKRILEVILFLPIMFYLMIDISKLKFNKRPNTLLFLVFLMFLVNFYFHDILWLFDYIFSFGAIYILNVTSKKNILIASKIIVFIASFFSVMALLQFLILFLFPNLSINTQLVQLDNGNWTSISDMEGATNLDNIHPIAFLGLTTNEKLNVFGFQINRMRSFTSEPSLLVVYMLFPCVMGLLMDGKKWTYFAIIILFFAIMSFSGSVQACILFSFIFIIASNFFSVKFIFTYLPFILLFLTIVVLMKLGLDNFISFDSSLRGSENTEFLAKGNSLLVRANGLVNTFYAAINSPFGNPNFSEDLPVSIFFNVIIKAGWLGAILLFLFFKTFFEKINHRFNSVNSLKLKFTTGLLFGIISTIIVFNDYAMLNYSGLVLLFFVYRLLETEKQLN